MSIKSLYSIQLIICGQPGTSPVHIRIQRVRHGQWKDLGVLGRHIGVEREGLRRTASCKSRDNDIILETEEREGTAMHNRSGCSLPRPSYRGCEASSTAFKAKLGQK